MGHRVAFSDQVRRAIESCGMSKYRVSREVGTSRAVINQFCQGRNISLPMLDRIADVLRLQVLVQGPRRAVLARAKRLARKRRE